MKKYTGFSLIELMVMLALVGVVAAFGLPQMTGMIQNNRLTSYMNSLSGNLAYARSESVKRGVPVNVTSNSADANWLSGWTVYIDADGDELVTPGEELRVVDAPNLPATTLTGPAGNLIYNPNGSVNAASTFRFTHDSQNRDINVLLTGKVEVAPY